MTDKKIDLFVPGRLCLLGEHSDWAGRYRMVNNRIEKGYAIVTGIEQGIYATAKMAENFIVRFKNDSKKSFKCKMEINELKKIAEKDDFWCYAAGVALYVKEQYNVNGLDITINNSAEDISFTLISDYNLTQKDLTDIDTKNSIYYEDLSSKDLSKLEENLLNVLSKLNLEDILN